ncbi:hypothetical protein GGI35DRAFT_490865 [Trichoderma velutinum]
MPFINTITAAIIALGAVTNGHMEMKSPPPFRSKYNLYSGDDKDYSMTSPLLGSGSDYPCKGYQRLLGSSEGKSVAAWVSGGSYNFTITGSANHGGGSCQASLSYDNGHTWRVIHSYIGECPLPQDSNWWFTVPSDAPTGNAMFAWTWFNKIGNREMYMNCAAVTITDGKKRSSSTSFAARPDIFVANVGNNICTYEGRDVQFPQPGPNFDLNSQGISPPGQGTCSGPPPVVLPPINPANSQSPPPQVWDPQHLATSSSTGDDFITSAIPKSSSLISKMSDGQPTAATQSQLQQRRSSVTVSQCSSSLTAPQSLSSDYSGGSAMIAAGSSCAAEGRWNCGPDGKYIQRCASGAWSASIPMADGTSCKPGMNDDALIMVN